MTNTFINEEGTFTVSHVLDKMFTVLCFKQNISDTRTFQDDLRSPFMVLPTYYRVSLKCTPYTTITTTTTTTSTTISTSNTATSTTTNTTTTTTTTLGWMQRGGGGGAGGPDPPCKITKI